MKMLTRRQLKLRLLQVTKKNTLFCNITIGTTNNVIDIFNLASCAVFSKKPESNITIVLAYDVKYCECCLYMLASMVSQLQALQYL